MTEARTPGRRARLVSPKVLALAIVAIAGAAIYGAYHPENLERYAIYRHVAWRWISDRDRHIQDIAAALPTEDLPRFERYMRYIARESDVVRTWTS